MYTKLTMANGGVLTKLMDTVPSLSLLERTSPQFLPTFVSFIEISEIFIRGPHNSLLLDRCLTVNTSHWKTPTKQCFHISSLFAVRQVIRA